VRLDALATVTAAVLVFAAVSLAVSQQRYLGLYGRVRGDDPMQAERIGPKPWLFFVLLPRISKDLYAAYSSRQPEPELERLRARVVFWRRATFGCWAVMMALGVLRLLGLA
jgi:hypothetical protein